MDTSKGTDTAMDNDVEKWNYLLMKVAAVVFYYKSLLLKEFVVY